MLSPETVGYLQMKRNATIASSGVLDNEEGLIKDMKDLSVEESRAVLCVLMLCFVRISNFVLCR